MSFSTKFSTWIIAYCPDIDSFFSTNQRYFYYEYSKEFLSEEESVNYFYNNSNEFAAIRNEIVTECGGVNPERDFYFEYSGNQIERYDCKGGFISKRCLSR